MHVYGKVTKLVAVTKKKKRLEENKAKSINHVCQWVAALGGICALTHDF